MSVCKSPLQWANNSLLLRSHDSRPKRCWIIWFASRPPCGTVTIVLLAINDASPLFTRFSAARFDDAVASLLICGAPALVAAKGESRTLCVSEGSQAIVCGRGVYTYRPGLRAKRNNLTGRCNGLFLA